MDLLLEILFFVLQFLISLTYAQDNQPVTQTTIAFRLLSTYDERVLPTEDGAVNVRLGLSIMDLEIDDFTGQVSVHGILQRKWSDTRLSWNPEDCSNITKILLPDNKIWKPDIELWNSGIALKTFDANVMVWSTGAIQQFQSLRIEFKCSMDYRYFPYDEQMCTMTFGSWHYHEDLLNLTSLYTKNYAQHNQPALDFNLVDFKTERHSVEYDCCGGERFVDLTYTLHLQRVSSEYSVKLVLPAVLSGFMVLATFLLPPASHEKVILCGLLFVGLLLQLIYIHDVVPASGGTMLADLLVFALFVDVFATAGAVASYHIATYITKAPHIGSDMSAIIKTDGDDSDLTIQMPAYAHKTKFLRYLDCALFLLFAVVYTIGLAIILGHRG